MFSGQLSRWQYIWRDRQGKNLGAIGDSGGVVMISPDGKRLVGDPGGTIVIQEFGRGATTRLTMGTSGGMNPAWSHDGRYVAYNGSGGIYRKSTEGGASPELLLRSQTLAVPKSWSPDGRYLIYAQVYPGTGSDLFALPIGQPGAQPKALWQTPATSSQGEFSPDGRWVAITSNDSGQSEIYVIPFPPTPNGERWAGSIARRWRNATLAARWERVVFHFTRLEDDGRGREHQPHFPIRHTPRSFRHRNGGYGNSQRAHELGHCSRW